MSWKKIVLIVGVAITATLPVLAYYWLSKDDELMDFSSMHVELGPSDPSINGYSKLRAISEDMTWDMGRLDEGLIDVNPFYPDESPLTPDEIRTMLTANEANMIAISEALAMEQFLFDQEISPDTLIPEVGQFRSYVDMRVLEARLQAMEGDPNTGLATLIQLSRDIEKFGGQHGGLVVLLTTASAAFTCNREIVHLISQYQPSQETLRLALKNYKLRHAITDQLPTSIRAEFQFCVYCTDKILNDPEMLGEKWAGKRLVSSPLFKPNRTKNTFFTNYSDMIEQVSLPVKERDFGWVDELVGDRSKLNLLISGNAVGRIMFAILIPAYESVFEKAAEADLNSDCTYLMLAMRLYQMENGTLPPTLEALVPDYIDAVPIDPFDGEPIRYDAERGILYSVGDDFVDSGGSDYLSRFDGDAPNFTDAYDEQEIAELDSSEPTYHIRFDVEPRPVTESQ